MAICFSYHESASSAELRWIEEMVNASAPVTVEDTHLQFNFINLLISFGISQGRVSIPGDR